MNDALTPVERRGDFFLKRDDLFEVAGVAGGKARTCWALAQGAEGVVTAGSRASPQITIVAHVAKELGIPCRAHAPSGPLTPELLAAEAVGAEIRQHRPGYNSVIVARAREDAADRPGWREIPFGMECEEAVRQTGRQVENIPSSVRRIVAPCGSGMSLAGILYGLSIFGLHDVPVLGIVVGASPYKRLERYAPTFWHRQCCLEHTVVDYDTRVEAEVGGVRLDPIYEAKCRPYMESGDLLWIVGIRKEAKE